MNSGSQHHVHDKKDLGESDSSAIEMKNVWRRPHKTTQRKLCSDRNCLIGYRNRKAHWKNLILPPMRKITHIGEPGSSANEMKNVWR